MRLRYHYRAVTSDGQAVEGVLEAPSRTNLLDELRRQRLYPTAVQEVAPAARRAGRWLSRRAAVAVWTRQMATLLAAGVPLDHALKTTTQHAGHDGLAQALREVRRSVQGGTSLAQALGEQPRFFPDLLLAMVAAGEASGALETVFEQVADHLQEAGELRSQVQSALLYPALMAVVASVGVAVLLLFVVPRFSAILEEVGGTLPLTTRLLVAGSTLLTNGWWAFLGLAAALAYGTRAALQRPDLRRRWHAARLRWPWIGELEHKYVTARFARTLALLLRSGVAILPALKIARSGTSNAWIREQLDRAAGAVTEGGALARALAGTLPPLALQMIAVGEESGKLEELCLRVADAYERDVRHTLRTMVSTLEPAMILLFGALVGFVALAMLQAIYSINTSVF